MASTASGLPHRTGQHFVLVEGSLTAFSGFGLHAEPGGGGADGAGLGPPKPLLIFLHGLGSAGSTFARVARELSASYRVLLPDLLGSGRTAKPLIEYTPREMAAHAAGLLRELGFAGPAGEPVAAIVGHSQGGAIAVELCQLLPGVAKVVLIDPPPPQGLRWLLPITGLPLDSRWAEMVSALLPHRLLAKLWLRFLYADPARITEEVLIAYAATSGGRGYAGATARAMHALARLDLPIERTPPTLLLWGERDRLFPVSGARAWQARLPDSRLRIVPAAGHCPHEEQPEAVAAALLGFLQPLAEPRSAA